MKEIIEYDLNKEYVDEPYLSWDKDSLIYQLNWYSHIIYNYKKIINKYREKYGSLTEDEYNELDLTSDPG